jgi:hypothetical protein
MDVTQVPLYFLVPLPLSPLQHFQFFQELYIAWVGERVHFCQGMEFIEHPNCVL